jgi:predicted dehydrogenase
VARLRIGIIGVGRHGSRYARHAARDVDGIELAAVCRRNEDEGRRIAEEFCCDYIADPLELIARPDIDAVVLVTVPHLLEQLVVAAAAAGKRLLVEKPVAHDLAAGTRMLQAIENAGIYCMAGHTLRFNTVANAMRERIDELGRVDTLVLSQRFPPQLDLDWIDDPDRSGGGNILHTGVHCFDLIRYIARLEPSTVACATSSAHTKRTEDNFAAWLTFADSGALALVTCSRSSDSRNGLIEISGEHGTLRGDHAHNTLVHNRGTATTPYALDPPAQTVCAVLDRLAGDASSGAAPLASFADGLAAVAVADACYRSARSGRREPVVLPHAGS